MKKRYFLIAFILVVLAVIASHQTKSNSVLPIETKGILYLEIWEMNKEYPSSTTIYTGNNASDDEIVEKIVYALNQLSYANGKQTFDKDDVIYDITIHMNDGSIHNVTLTSSIVRIRSKEIERYQTTDELIIACKAALLDE